MEIEEFKEHLKGLKPCKETAFIDHNTKCFKMPNGWKILNPDGEGVLFTTDYHKNITIFQGNMIYAIFHLKKRPVDYASYHKCIAGKEFINSIKEINVVKRKDIPYWQTKNIYTNV